LTEVAILDRYAGCQMVAGEIARLRRREKMAAWIEGISDDSREHLKASSSSPYVAGCVEGAEVSQFRLREPVLPTEWRVGP